jgi:hypothetical protein
VEFGEWLCANVLKKVPVTAGKPGSKQKNQTSTCILEGIGLLDSIQIKRCCRFFPQTRELLAERGISNEEKMANVKKNKL